METNNRRHSKKNSQVGSIYSRSLLNRRVVLPITSVGKNIHQTIEDYIIFNFEGKCAVEGYIKNGSTKVLTYSCGLIERGVDIVFDVIFECDVCFPVEGMNIECIAKNITKAGIRAESANDAKSPFVLFVAKDHYYNSEYFSDIKETDKFIAKVIGQRFELNDSYISIIGELVKPKRVYQVNK
jgi:hypothetical protein